MGSGIAQWLSSRGVSVILRDVDAGAIDRGLANIEKTYADAVKRGLMTRRESAGRARPHRRFHAADGIARRANRDRSGLGKTRDQERNFSRSREQAAPKAILATNTSALPIESWRRDGSPERVIGLHFFNPVSRMKLIEVVVGRQTSEETRDRALAFARQIGKLPVVVRDSPGFLVNRVLFPYLLDAAELFESGAGRGKIDHALVQWGMPMGPLRLIDEIGVDITVDIADTLEKAFGRRDRAPDILRKMRDGKMLGRKSGGGFYKYEGKTQTPNEAFRAMAAWVSMAIRKALKAQQSAGPASRSPTLRAE